VSDFLADDQAITEQEFLRSALDPGSSCVVEACAGSGKTWLLVGRMIRLLLAGCAPADILAITFTRKAAQEMRTRLSADLQALAFAPDAQAKTLLRARGIDPATSPDAMTQARGLYERVLAAELEPTIDTFHGWFWRLLQNAPLDAGVPFAPSLLEQTERLRSEAWQLFSAGLSKPGGERERGAYLEVVALIGANNANTLLNRFFDRRTEWWTYRDSSTQPPLARAVLPMQQALEREGFDEHSLPAAKVRDRTVVAAAGEFATVLAQVPRTGKQVAELIERAQAWLRAAPGDPRGDLGALRDLIFTQDDTPRQVVSPESIEKKYAPGKQREYGMAWTRLAAALERLAQAQREFDAIRLNRAALVCGERLIDIYQELKARQQQLDFADIEWHARRLLIDDDHAAYVQARLDTRFRHILIDEFQDTNPLQWQILERWLGAYQGDPERPTVFVVGDPKQSIYGFRRAEPRLFSAAIDLLRRHFGARHLRTNVTRRNAKSIVAALDKVFESGNGLYQPQSTVSLEQGKVYLQDLIEAIKPEKIDSSVIPELRDVLTDARPNEESDAREREGARLADTIARFVAATTVTEESGTRKARWSDVLLLVRRRTHLESLERALRDAGVPFVSDRAGGLLSTLEASDVIALLEFLAAPFADVKLAQVLRSPFFGATDADLLQLADADGMGIGMREAGNAPAGNWWKRLRTLGGLSSALERAKTLLETWVGLAGVLPVHDLLDRVFFDSDARRRFAAAAPATMHPQAQANLDRVLELALSLDSGRYPSLSRFLDEVAALQRTPDQEAPAEGVAMHGDAIRIATIHGAKGLESEIVVLADAHIQQANEEGFRPLIAWPPQAQAPEHMSLLGRIKAPGLARRAWLEEEERQRAQEHWNLLYVAMTRARQVLIVSGVESLRGEKGYEDTWYKRVESFTERADLPPAVQIEAGVGATRTVRDFQPTPCAAGSYRTVLEQDPVRLGRAWHRVLESAASVAALERLDQDAMARSFQLDPAQTAQVLDAARKVLSSPHLVRFFSAPGEAELELLDGGELLRIDRLVEADDAWWVLDFKWRVGVSERATYERQVTRYRDVVQSIHPERVVRAALVVADGELIELD
jgi:ATP-dependent helicase/nuclease subunit A